MEDVQQKAIEAAEPKRGVRGFFRRHRVLLSLLAIVVIGAAAIIHHKRAAAKEDSGRGGPNGPTAVAVATVAKGDIAVRIPALGAITSLATVTVKAQISGQLQKIAFQEGQLVHEGDFLAQIDPRPYEAALSAAKANLRRDEALLTNARVDQKRYQGLLAEDGIAAQQLDTQKALVEQYQGTVAGDQAQVSTAALNLQYTHIVAPVTGQVGLRQVDQGNYVTVGDTNGIVVITQMQPITAIFSVPEDNVTTLVQRLRAGAALDVDAYDRGNSTKLASGKLSTIDNQIDATTGTIKLRAVFDNAAGLLFPNQFVNIQLLVNTLRDQIVMPNAAVQRGAPNGTVSTFVYRVNADHTVAVQPIVLGVVDGERVAVRKGLAAGDIVVTEGGDRLRDGAPVLLPDGAAKPTGAANHKADNKFGNHPDGATHKHRHADAS